MHSIRSIFPPRRRFVRPLSSIGLAAAGIFRPGNSCIFQVFDRFFFCCNIHDEFDIFSKKIFAFFNFKVQINTKSKFGQVSILATWKENSTTNFCKFDFNIFHSIATIASGNRNGDIVYFS